MPAAVMWILKSFEAKDNQDRCDGDRELLETCGRSRDALFDGPRGMTSPTWPTKPGRALEASITSPSFPPSCQYSYAGQSESNIFDTFVRLYLVTTALPGVYLSVRGPRQEACLEVNTGKFREDSLCVNSREDFKVFICLTNYAVPVWKL